MNNPDLRLADKSFTIVMMVPLRASMILLVGIFAILPGTLLQQLLSYCPPKPICPSESKEILCRAEGYYWHKFNRTIPAMVANVYHGRTTGPVHYVGVFRSPGDMKLHVTRISPGGRILFNNKGKMVKPVKILRHYPPFRGNSFAYVRTMPRTMKSPLPGNPDLREGSVVLGDENGALTYFGATVTESGSPFYGKIAMTLNEAYEMTYVDASGFEERTGNFQVLMMKICSEIIKATAERDLI